VHLIAFLILYSKIDMKSSSKSSMRGPRKTKPVGVLTKALRVVDLLQDSGSPLSLHEISIQAGLNKSTALRLLAHLEGGKYLRRDERGGYSLGPKFLRLGSDYNVQAPLRELAHESLWELWRVTQETVNLAVLDGLDVVYIDCLESPHDLRLVSNVGMRAVLYRTALGKALLAFQPAEQRERLIKSLRFETFTPHTVTSAFELTRELNSIRESGFAVDNEESVVGLRCIAAPILDTREIAVAAISISGPTSRITPQKTPMLGDAVKAAAREVSGRIVSQPTVA
jgi:DNA-binding IclR family transcriptional regulator